MRFRKECSEREHVVDIADNFIVPLLEKYGAYLIDENSDKWIVSHRPMEEQGMRLYQEMEATKKYILANTPLDTVLTLNTAPSCPVDVAVVEAVGSNSTYNSNLLDFKELVDGLTLEFLKKVVASLLQPDRKNSIIDLFNLHLKDQSTDVGITAFIGELKQKRKNKKTKNEFVDSYLDMFGGFAINKVKSFLEAYCTDEHASIPGFKGKRYFQFGTVTGSPTYFFCFEHYNDSYKVVDWTKENNSN